MVKRNEEEKISDLSTKIKQLEAQKRLLEARSKEKERKARTRRLIQIGAVLDVMGIDTLEIAEGFKNYFQNNSEANDFLQKIILEIRK